MQLCPCKIITDWVVIWLCKLDGAGATTVHRHPPLDPAETILTNQHRKYLSSERVMTLDLKIMPGLSLRSLRAHWLGGVARIVHYSWLSWLGRADDPFLLLATIHFCCCKANSSSIFNRRLAHRVVRRPAQCALFHIARVVSFLWKKQTDSQGIMFSHQKSFANFPLFSPFSRKFNLFFDILFISQKIRTLYYLQYNICIKPSLWTNLT